MHIVSCVCCVPLVECLFLVLSPLLGSPRLVGRWCPCWCFSCGQRIFHPELPSSHFSHMFQVIHYQSCYISIVHQPFLGTDNQIGEHRLVLNSMKTSYIGLSKNLMLSINIHQSCSLNSITNHRATASSESRPPRSRWIARRGRTRRGTVGWFWTPSTCETNSLGISHWLLTTIWIVII